jgi:hypothetical protein
MADFRLLLPDDRGIMRSVDDEGVLSFVITAGEGAAIRGTEMFDLMMRAFGSRVGAIAGVWRKGFEGRPSTNLDTVNVLTESGLPLEEAVCRTWTATRAARWGFTKVTVVGVPAGVPGYFSKIDVLIQKPEGSP